MKILHALAWLIALAALAGVAFIATAPATQDPFDVYREQLTRLATVAPPAAGSPAEAAALARFEGFVTDLSADNIRRSARTVYAADAVLSDTLAVVNGHAAIEAYFLASAERGVDVTVEVDDVVRSGDDHYVRWTMTIVTPSLRSGAPLTSAGMSHIRLNEAGKVALHYDFWDSGHGLFEHLPGSGGLLRRFRERLH